MESCKILDHSNSKASKAAQQANAQAIYSVPQEGFTICWVVSGGRWSKVQNRAALRMFLYQKLSKCINVFFPQCNIIHMGTAIWLKKMGIGRSAVIRTHGTSELRIAGPAVRRYTKLAWWSTTCHSWIWIKGMNHILGDVHGYASRLWIACGSRLTFWAMANISHIIPKDCHRDGMRLLEARSTKAHWSIEEPCRLERLEQLFIPWAWDVPHVVQSIERKTVKLPTAHDVTNGKPFHTNIVYVHYMEVS